MQRLAIYDMDKTITRRPTWTRFLIHYAQRQAPWRLGLLPVAGALAAGHPLKLIDRVQLKQATHRLLIGGRVAPARIARAAESFARREHRRGLFAAALERIAADRAAGYRIVIATASHRFYAEAIARLVGADAVVATEAQRDARGRVRHRLAGDNCYGAAKLDHLQAWLAREGIARADAHIRFYSDHISDAPSLDWADEGFVINPDPALVRLAEARGWERFDWR
ncbi:MULTISPECIES: HAD family hydrolase [Sphingomonas]|uniref:HAD family hydrolase n=1 Tax=Sphingomonas TaxID=13687 RepID=UPI00082B524B|nr:HAD-IB family phosphatase [Sphingomonas sp. CCH10-B3]